MNPPAANEAVPLARQIACVEREIGFRQRCYPRWVALKRMGQSEAERELAAMQAVLETLRGIEAAGSVP